MTNRTIDERQIPQVQYTTPTTGSTVTANTSGNVKLLLNPAGALLALTIALNGAPSDGDTLNISASQAITTLTMSGGTVIGPLTSAAIGTFAIYIYSSTSSNWFRTG